MSENPFSLGGKTILITGASSGIGRATAKACANMGASIVAVGRDERRLEETMAALGTEGSHRAICADLTTSEGMAAVAEQAATLHGLALCAGKLTTAPIPFCDRGRFDDIFNINFFATVELLRTLYKKKKIGKGASVVAIASMGGTDKYEVGGAIYGASKAALDSFMKFAAKEFAARKVRVNTICPGMVETPMIRQGTLTDEQLANDEKSYPLGRYGQPDDVALAAVFLLSDASAWITGTSLRVDGGLSLV